MRVCIRCSCTEWKACLEFDADGYAHPCFWFATDLCSACAFNDYISASKADDTVDTPLRVPELAGMVARPRSAGPQPKKRRP